MNSSKDSRKYLIRFIIAMAAFGTIGIFRRFIPLDSGIIAMARGIIGAVFIFIFLAVRGRPFAFSHLKGKIWQIMLIGAIMGFNWVTLFEAYNYTAVSTATLCYYMEPLFLILISPFVFREKITWKKLLCVLVAFVGMIFVSGVLSSEVGTNDLTGIVFGLLSAVLYAIVVSWSRLITDVDPYEKTALQLLSAGVVMIPYLLAKGAFADPSLAASFTPLTITMLAIVCIVHTGIVYLMYFESINHIKVSQIAVLSYIDPVVAIILSQVILHENMGWQGLIGAVLILGAAFVSEKV